MKTKIKIGTSRLNALLVKGTAFFTALTLVLFSSTVEVKANEITEGGQTQKQTLLQLAEKILSEVAIDAIDSFSLKSNQISSSDSDNSNLNPTLSAISPDEEVSTLATGSGSAASPFLIANESDLALISYNIGIDKKGWSTAYYKMTKDINLAAWGAKGDKNHGAGGGWYPIGNLFNKFKGNFNGNGKKISNFYIGVGNEGCALFGAVQNAEIHDLTISGGSITCRMDDNASAGFAGFAEDSTFTNLVNKVKISESGDTGGIIGNAAGKVVLKNCKNEAELKTGFPNKKNIAGLVGIGAEVNIENSSNTGAITNVSEKSYLVGGLIGTAVKATIVNSNNTGVLTNFVISTKKAVEATIGGLAAKVDNLSVTSSSNTGITSVVSNDTVLAGGIVGTVKILTAEKVFNSGEISGLSVSNEESKAAVQNYLDGATAESSSSNYEGIAGGIAGSITIQGNIAASYNNGNILGGKTAGGIVGSAVSSNISDVYSSGAAVASGKFAGGIVGSLGAKSEVSNSISLTGKFSAQYAELFGNPKIGRIVANNDATAKLSNNYGWFEQRIGDEIADPAAKESIHGANFLTADIYKSIVWSNIFAETGADWIFANGKLPLLKVVKGSQSAIIPEHLEAPGSPRNFSAKIVNKKVKLSWDLPYYTGKTAITNYELLIFDQTDFKAFSIGNTKSYTTPLGFGKMTFSIMAVNSNGTSEPVDTQLLPIPKLKKKTSKNPYKDLGKLSKAVKSDVTWLYQYGIAASAKKYNPKSKVTRGAMAQFLYKMSGSPALGDVKKQKKELKNDRLFAKLAKSNKARYNSILWLTKARITIPSNNKFNPQNFVNRGAMAQFLYNFAGSPKVTIKQVRAAEKIFKADKEFKKLKKSNLGRYSAICWLASTKITVGSKTKGKIYYHPENAVTRSAMATFLHKLAVYLEVG